MNIENSGKPQQRPNGPVVKATTPHKCIQGSQLTSRGTVSDQESQFQGEEVLTDQPVLTTSIPQIRNTRYTTIRGRPRGSTQLGRFWVEVRAEWRDSVFRLFGNERGRWVATFPRFNLNPQALPQAPSPFSRGTGESSSQGDNAKPTPTFPSRPKAFKKIRWLRVIPLLRR